jgi:hypothetical protein
MRFSMKSVGEKDKIYQKKLRKIKQEFHDLALYLGGK